MYYVQKLSPLSLVIVHTSFVKDLFTHHHPSHVHSIHGPTWLIKDYFDILITPISILTNIYLAQRVFPDQFKTAVVIPLLKKPTLDKEQN